MQKPYRDIDEMFSLSLGIINTFTGEELKKVIKWYKLSLHYPDYYTPFSLQNVLYECFWNIPEAIEVGFHKFYYLEMFKFKEIMNYHNANCEGSNCIICADRERLLKSLGGKYERKEPRIHNKQPAKKQSSHKMPSMRQ